MNLTHKEVKPYSDRFFAEVGEVNEVQVVFIASFTSIPAFATALEKSPNFSKLGAQDMHWEQRTANFHHVSNPIKLHSKERRLFCGLLDRGAQSL
jgi:triosephosphate isomerase